MEDVRWFGVDIREHTEELPGDYEVTFDHERGEGGLRVFEVRLNYNR